MKKIISILLFMPFLGFAQNSVLTDPNGVQAIQKIIGVGTGTVNNGLYTTKTSQYLTTGSVSSSLHVVGLNAVVNNSNFTNTALMGIAGGSGSNYGIIGSTNGTGSGVAYGGFFSAGGSSTGTKYGIYATIPNTFPSAYNQYAGYFSNIGNSSLSNFGVRALTDNQGNGDAVAGYFRSENALNNIGLRYGLISESIGAGTNFGLQVIARGGSTNIAGEFESVSNPATGSYQLILNDIEDNFARISFSNINGEGWHQAVYRGSTAATSQFNFYYVPNSVDILSLKGDGNAILAGTLTQSSDFRLKKNIVSIKGATQKLTQLNGVYFDWKDEKRNPNQQIGFIAQEVEKVFPQLVETDAKGYKSVAYGNFTAVLVEALKEQNLKIELLEKELNEIKNLLKNSQIIESKNSKLP